MFLTLSLLAKKAKAKHIMVSLESLVSGHRINKVRERLADKLELIQFDPRIQEEAVYKELKKVKSMSSHFKPSQRPFRPISRFKLL